jgi:hypothetical protein
MMNTNGRALSKWLRSLFFGVLFLGATTQAAFATVMLTNSRAAITTLSSQVFTVDWGALGGDLTPLGSTFSNGPVTVSGGSAFAVFNGSTYNGDFNPDDSVLSLFDLNTFDTVSGVFSLSFASAVRAAGAQVQALLFGGFTGTISAFDAANGLLGSFNVSGTTGGNNDGSAVFAGIISDSINITRIEFAGFGSGAAINQVTANVPEPSTFLLMLGPLVFLVAARRRRIRG